MAASMPVRPKQIKPKNRKTKTCLVFDEKARSDYLRGFHKRKNERKKLAREKNDRRVLEERKELLKQVRESTNNAMRQHAVMIPEIEGLVDPQIYDLPEHTVTVANIGEVDFVGNSGVRLGQNTGKTKVKQRDADTTNDDESNFAKPVKNKSLRQRLAACTSQLSSQIIKAKRSKKKNMLRQKFKGQKKGQKKGKK